MPERRNITLLLEPVVILLSIIFFVLVKSYYVIPPTSPYYISGMVALQLSIGMLLIYSISIFLEAYGRHYGNQKEMHETAHIFKLIAYPVLLLILLHTLNVSIAGLLVGAGFLGIIVGLAAQTSLGNVFASLSIVYSRPFIKGEKITIVPTSYSFSAPSYTHDTMMNEITGTVKSIGLIYTRILRDDMSMTYMPNSVINQGLIINHSRSSDRQIKIRLVAARSTNLSSFKQKLIAKLSKEKEDFYKLKDLDIKLTLLNEEETYGIIVTSRVKVLEYDRLSQWLSENAIKSLYEVEKKQRRK